MKVLVSGAAGFIGARVMYELSKRGDEVVGIDNLNDYYDVRLKFARLAENGFYDKDSIYSGSYQISSIFPNCRFLFCDISDEVAINQLFDKERFDKVVNLAAQAGVRYSIDNPKAYLNSNLIGYFNIIEACKGFSVKHLIYASSSSVYGLNKTVPFKEEDKVSKPVSLYAATKLSNEVMAYSYCNLYGIAMTGLRYFTVYGPWGRPDMSPMIFASSIERGRPIRVFNNGDMIRDFTYIDDIVEGTISCIDKEPAPDHDGLKYRVYNIGSSHPVCLLDFIHEIENAIGKKAKIEYAPMQAGDVYQTYADTSLLEREIGYKPHVLLHDGIEQFILWYHSNKNPLR